MNNLNTKQKFSIRKYHIGAASVLIGSLIGLNITVAHAEEVVSTNSELVVQTDSSTTPETENIVEDTPPVAKESEIAASAQVEYISDAKITVTEEFKNALLERERIMRDIPVTQTESAYLKSGSEIESNAAHKANHETLKRLGQEHIASNQYKNDTDIREVDLTEIDSSYREEINLFAVDLINQLRAGIGNQEKLLPVKGMFEFAKDVVRNSKSEYAVGASDLTVHQYSVINEAAKNAGIAYNADSTAGQLQQDIVYFEPRKGFSLPLNEELKDRLKALPNEWKTGWPDLVKFNYGIDTDSTKIDQYDWSDMVIHEPNYIPTDETRKNEEAQKLIADIWQEKSKISMGKLKEYVYEGIKKLAFTSGDDYFTNKPGLPASKRYWELALSTFGEFYAENNKYAAVTWSMRGSDFKEAADPSNPYSGKRFVRQYLFIHPSYTAPKDASEYETEENKKSKSDTLQYVPNKITSDNFDRTLVTLKNKVETIYKDNGDGGLNAFIKTTNVDGTITEVADTPNNKVKSTVKVDTVAKIIKYEADTASQLPAGTEISRAVGKEGYTERTTTWTLDAQGNPKEIVVDSKVEMVQEVVKISTKSDVKETTLTKTTEYKEAPTKDFGYKETTITGRDGVIVETTTYTLKPDGTVEKNPVQENRIQPVNEVIEVGTKPTERTETVARGTKYEANATLEANVQNVKVEGKDGSKVFVTEYDFDAATGKATPRKEALKPGTEVVAEDKVIEVGTKPTERTETVARGTKYEANATLEANVQNVKVEGKDGSKVFVTEYDFDAATGKATPRKEALKPGTEVVAEDKVIEVGTKSKTETRRTASGLVTFKINYILDVNTGNVTQTEEVINGSLVEPILVDPLRPLILEPKGLESGGNEQNKANIPSQQSRNNETQLTTTEKVEKIVETTSSIVSQLGKSKVILPKTGVENTTITSLTGVTMLLGALGLAGKRRRKNGE